MDDKTFNDTEDARAWISSVESEKGQARGNDIFPRLKSWIDRVSPLEILEIGSGQGVCSDRIDLDGRNYTGIEPSLIFTNRAKELYFNENRKFVLGNAYNIPFRDDVFDASFSILVWHLLSDLKNSANELSRVLKANGHFLIITANPDAYSLWTDFYTDTKLEGRRFEGKMQLIDQSVIHDVLHLHSYDEIKSALQDANLKVQETEQFRTSEKSKGQKYLISIQGQKLLK